MHKTHKIYAIAAVLKPTNGIGFENDLPWRKALGTLREDMEHFHNTTTRVSGRASGEDSDGRGAADALAPPGQGSVTFSPSPRASDSASRPAQASKAIASPVQAFDSASLPLQNMVVMGRNTWNSIPLSHKPLVGRRNVVLARDVEQVRHRHKARHIVSSYDEALALADNTIADIFIIGGSSVYAEALRRPETDGVYITHVYADFPCDTFFPQLPPAFAGQPERLGSGKQDGVRYEFLLYLRKGSL